MSTVPIFAPDGSLGDVPYEQMRAAINAGGKPGVTVKSPDGKLGVIPADRMQDAARAGATIVPFEQQETQHPGFWHTLYSDLSDAVKSAPQLLTQFSSDPATMARNMKANQDRILAQVGGEEKDNRSGAYKAAAAVVAPFVNVPGMEESAREGDVGGVMGHAAATPTAMALTAGAGEGLEEVGSAADTPTGKAVAAGIKAAAKKIVPSAIKRIPYVGNVVGDVAEAAKTAYSQAKAARIADAGRAAAETPDLEGVTSEQTEHAGEVNEEIPAETPAAKAAEPAPKPDTSPKKMGELLNQATGGRPLAKNVPLKDQIKAAVQAQAPLPEGFTRALSKNADTGELEPSDVLRGYQYDLAKREFTAITNTGQSYTHGDVSPEEVEAFENADSKGKAWNQLRSQNVQVAKNGRSTVPIARRSIVIDPETGQPEFSDVVAAKQAAAKAAPAKAAPEPPPSPQMDAMQQMLKRAKKGEKLADMKTQ